MDAPDGLPEPRTSTGRERWRQEERTNRILASRRAPLQETSRLAATTILEITLHPGPWPARRKETPRIVTLSGCLPPSFATSPRPTALVCEKIHHPLVHPVNISSPDQNWDNPKEDCIPNGAGKGAWTAKRYPTGTPRGNRMAASGVGSNRLCQSSVNRRPDSLTQVGRSHRVTATCKMKISMNF